MCRIIHHGNRRAFSCTVWLTCSSSTEYLCSNICVYPSPPPSFLIVTLTPYIPTSNRIILLLFRYVVYLYRASTAYQQMCIIFIRKTILLFQSFSRGSLRIRSTALSNNNYYHYSFAGATDDRKTRRERGGVTKESLTRIVITQLQLYASIYTCRTVRLYCVMYRRTLLRGNHRSWSHAFLSVLT